MSLTESTTALELFDQRLAILKQPVGDRYPAPARLLVEVNGLGESIDLDDPNCESLIYFGLAKAMWRNFGEIHGSEVGTRLVRLIESFGELAGLPDETMNELMYEAADELFK